MPKRVKRLRPSRRWAEEGVASTVGTIMAIMVILALLSLIINHYVPVSMKDNESNHMDVALSQLGDFKSAIDNQIVYAEVMTAAGKNFSAIPVYTSIKMGSDGFPIFASPTQGELAVDRQACALSVSGFYNINGTDYGISSSSKGQVFLSVPNRYYVPQRLIYEAGAVIRWQSDGSALIAEPQFSVVNRTLGGSPNYEVAMTMIWLFGEGSASGSGLQGINSKLISLDMQRYENITTDSSIYVNYSTDYGPAWYDSYNYSLRRSYSPDVVWFYRNETLTITSTSFYNITLIWNKAMNDYTLVMQLKNTGNGLKRFDLNTAMVEVSIGQKKGSA